MTTSDHCLSLCGRIPSERFRCRHHAIRGAVAGLCSSSLRIAGRRMLGLDRLSERSAALAAGGIAIGDSNCARPGVIAAAASSACCRYGGVDDGMNVSGCRSELRPPGTSGPVIWGNMVAVGSAGSRSGDVLIGVVEGLLRRSDDALLAASRLRVDVIPAIRSGARNFNENLRNTVEMCVYSC